MAAGCIRVNSVLKPLAVKVTKSLSVIGRAKGGVESTTILFHALILARLQLFHSTIPRKVN